MKYPLKLSFKTEILPVLIIVMALVMSLYFYMNFPDKVASHWNFAGQVNGYMNRAGGAFFMPVLLMGMYMLFLVLPVIDPKRERYTEFDQYYRLFRTAIMTTFLVVYAAMGLFNLGYPIQISTVVSGSIGILFVVLGSFMRKIKNNWFMGIRTPWTLSSEKVWNKTHQAGGWLFVIYGIVIMITPYLPQFLGVSLFIAGAVMMVLGTTVYSYWLYRQEKK